jgi:hypothetical protein
MLRGIFVAYHAGVIYWKFWFLIIPFPEDTQGHSCSRFLIIYKAIKSGTFHPGELPLPCPK